MTATFRPRIVERLQRATAFPVTLLFAPAGSGKSVALEQFRATVSGVKTIDAGAVQTADGFERALDAAIAHASEGCIVVEGLQAVQSDTAFAQPLIDRIAAMTPSLRWVLASRSSADLPVGTWLSYGVCDGIIGPRDLAFTSNEVRTAIDALGCVAEDDELCELLEFTEGWAAAVGVALRAFAEGDRHRWRAAVRDASHRFYDECAYPEIEAPARKLLEIAATLPEIDVPLLEAAGFCDARRLLEDVGRRVGLVAEESSGRYRMPRLFREFLRRRLDLQTAQERNAVYRTAAAALESDGRVDAAVDAYVQALARDDLLRLLEETGFDLLERGQGAVVTRAIDALSDAQKRSNPRILALRGALQSLAGNPVRAEALLRRALSRAGNDPDLFAAISLRLALVLTNQGKPNEELLLPIVGASQQNADNRGEAWSLLAAAYALANRPDDARNAMDQVQQLFSEIDSDPVRARILQRTGVAAMYIGEIEKARAVLSEAAELSLELGLFSLASRAYANLSNLMLHRFDDVDWQLWYAQQAAESASRAGNQFDIETALLQLLNAELRFGKASDSYEIENRILRARSPDQSRAHYLAPAKALLLAWDGKFGDAYGILAPSLSRLHHALDRAVSTSEAALYLAIDGRRDSAISTAGKAIRMLGDLKPEGPFYLRSITAARICCAVAEAVSGRQAHADRLLLQMSTSPYDAVVASMRTIGDELVASTRRRNKSDAETNAQMKSLIERLSALGYAHITRLFISVNATLESRKPQSSAQSLSSTQIAILQAMADGLTPKEIALRRGSSVNTVRKHIARSIAKLRCSGQVETIAQARRMGLLA